MILNSKWGNSVEWKTKIIFVRLMLIQSHRLKVRKFPSSNYYSVSYSTIAIVSVQKHCRRRVLTIRWSVYLSATYYLHKNIILNRSFIHCFFGLSNSIDNNVSSSHFILLKYDKRTTKLSIYFEISLLKFWGVL